MGRYGTFTTLDIEETSSNVLTVRLSRPEVFNATNSVLHSELARFMSELRMDPEPGAVVITGQGKAFCAGGDIDWLVKITPAEVDRLFDEARTVITDLLDVRQPVIAAVNGAAAGFGATLALFCDIVVAGESARFSDPHVDIGLVAGDGGAVIWPWLVGMNRAKEFLLLGDTLSAADAHSLGLVNRVVPDDDLLPSALELAQRLADGPRQAIQGTKLTLNAILRETVNAAFDVGLSREKACFWTDEYRQRVEKWAGSR